MAQFAGRLSRPDFQLGRPVVDFTGLEGTFDLTRDWKPEGDQPESQSDGAERPSLYTALPEQLGLRLEPRRVALEVFVVDDALKVPLAN